MLRAGKADQPGKLSSNSMEKTTHRNSSTIPSQHHHLPFGLRAMPKIMTTMLPSPAMIATALKASQYGVYRRAFGKSYPCISCPPSGEAPAARGNMTLPPLTPAPAGVSCKSAIGRCGPRPPSRLRSGLRHFTVARADAAQHRKSGQKQHASIGNTRIVQRSLRGASPPAFKSGISYAGIGEPQRAQQFVARERRKPGIGNIVAIEIKQLEIGQAGKIGHGCIRHIGATR